MATKTYLTKAGKLIAIPLVVVAMLYVLGYYGYIGFNPQWLWPITLLGLGGFLFVESAIENKKKVMKGWTPVEIILGLAHIIWGFTVLAGVNDIQLLMGTDLTGGLTLGTVALVAGSLFALAETFTKI
jgi:FtsH-binding integral membrane protein